MTVLHRQTLLEAKKMQFCLFRISGRNGKVEVLRSQAPLEQQVEALHNPHGGKPWSNPSAIPSAILPQSMCLQAARIRNPSAIPSAILPQSPRHPSAILQSTSAIGCAASIGYPIGTHGHVEYCPWPSAIFPHPSEILLQSPPPSFRSRCVYSPPEFATLPQSPLPFFRNPLRHPFAILQSTSAIHVCTDPCTHATQNLEGLA
jgi:hypothetical protein